LIVFTELTAFVIVAAVAGRSEFTVKAVALRSAATTSANIECAVFAHTFCSFHVSGVASTEWIIERKRDGTWWWWEAFFALVLSEYVFSIKWLLDDGLSRVR
jgi:hypothetical protein